MGGPAFGRRVDRPADLAVRSVNDGGGGDFGQLEELLGVTANSSDSTTVFSNASGDPPVTLEFINVLSDGNLVTDSDSRMDVIARDESNNLIYSYRAGGGRCPEQFPITFAIPSGGSLEVDVENKTSNDHTYNIEGAIREVR